MITAIVTLFNPKRENANNIYMIDRQVDRVFACDNSKSDNSALFFDCPNTVVYMPFFNNLGLSKAFNKVLKDYSLWENNDKDDWVIFFDQDSSIEDGHVEKLIQEYRNIQSQGINIGCLGPVYYDTSSGNIEIPKDKKRISEFSFIVSSIITSSMLTRYETLKEVGFWNERLFLDMADWDLCWRMQSYGKKSCLTKAVTLHHTLGQGRKKIGPISLKIANPIREYYQIRDCLYLRNEKYVPIKYKIRFILMVYIRSYLHIRYLDHGEERRAYIARAKQDYKKGVRGEYKSLPILHK